MKNTYILLLAFFSILHTEIFAQACELPTAQTDLEINNVRARLKTGGDLWWDGSDGKYIVPKPAPGELGVSAFFASGLWIGGIDPGANISLAAQTYGSATGSTDYWTGYLEDGSVTSTICSDFDRFWVSSSADIDLFLLDWQDGQLDGSVPTSILAWPGRGNPNFFNIHGFELPLTEQGFAPFIDTDSDGLYDPQQGDYPDINGADQGIWWIFNDAGNTHMNTDSEPLEFEIQVLAYAYSSTNPNINNATFYDYKIINRGLEDLDSTYVGIWSDVDLGCYTDDYVGCDTSQHLGYAYNSDAIDGNENCACTGVPTYCEEIPLVGIKMLKGVDGEENGEIVDRGMSSFTYNNTTPGGGQLPEGDDVQGYYNLLSGTWIDGTPFTYGGDGYNPSGEPVKYVFTDSPNDPNGWSMANEELPGADQRMLLGSGPFDISPGEVNTFSFAVLFVENIAHPLPSIDSLLAAAEDAQQLFDNGTITSTSSPFAANLSVSLFPNPMTETATLSIASSAQLIETVTLYSADGKIIEVISEVNSSEAQIQRQGRPAGLYYYQLTTDQGEIVTGKFILQ